MADTSPPLFALLTATLYSATPLTLAAMGGVLSEKAGVVNIALEGLILAGAFVGVFVTAGGASSAVGLLAALGMGACLGLLHACLTQRLKLDHVVSGLGINLLAEGGTRFLWTRYYPNGITVGGVPRLLFLAAALVLPFLVQYVLTRTRFGLRLRAVGENPESAEMAGVGSRTPRYLAVVLSGVLAALAGASLSLGDARTFSTNMSAGKGFIALAAVIFGKWNPLGAAGGALFFGFFYALQTQMQIGSYALNWFGIEWTSSYLLDMLPYVMTLIALVSVVGKATPPAALGKEE